MGTVHAINPTAALIVANPKPGLDTRRALELLAGQTNLHHEAEEQEIKSLWKFSLHATTEPGADSSPQPAPPRRKHSLRTAPGRECDAVTQPQHPPLVNAACMKVQRVVYFQRGVHTRVSAHPSLEGRNVEELICSSA